MMMDNIDEVTDKRIKAPKDMERDKAQVAQAYNKKVKKTSFSVENCSTAGTESNKFGKRLSSWEGPL